MAEGPADRKKRLKHASNRRYYKRIKEGIIFKQPRNKTESKEQSKNEDDKKTNNRLSPDTNSKNDTKPNGKPKDKTNKKVEHLIKSGQVLNPTGRPKGARSVFSDSFYKDLAKVWQSRGIIAMTKVADEDPATFIRVCASLMPKQFKAEIHDQRTLLVELIGASSDTDEDLTAGGVMRPKVKDIVEAEFKENGKNAELPQMPEMVVTESGTESA